MKAIDVIKAIFYEYGVVDGQLLVEITNTDLEYYLQDVANEYIKIVVIMINRLVRDNTKYVSKDQVVAELRKYDQETNFGQVTTLFNMAVGVTDNVSDDIDHKIFKKKYVILAPYIHKYIEEYIEETKETYTYTGNVRKSYPQLPVIAKPDYVTQEKRYNSSPEFYFDTTPTPATIPTTVGRTPTLRESLFPIVPQDEIKPVRTPTLRESMFPEVPRGSLKDMRAPTLRESMFPDVPRGSLRANRVSSFSQSMFPDVPVDEDLSDQFYENVVKGELKRLQERQEQKQTPEEKQETLDKMIENLKELRDIDKMERELELEKEQGKRITTTLKEAFDLCWKEDFINIYTNDFSTTLYNKHILPVLRKIGNRRYDFMEIDLDMYRIGEEKVINTLVTDIIELFTIPLDKKAKKDLREDGEFEFSIVVYFTAILK